MKITKETKQREAGSLIEAFIRVLNKMESNDELSGTTLDSKAELEYVNHLCKMIDISEPSQEATEKCLRVMAELSGKYGFAGFGEDAERLIEVLREARNSSDSEDTKAAS